LRLCELIAAAPILISRAFRAVKEIAFIVITTGKLQLSVRYLAFVAMLAVGDLISIGGLAAEQKTAAVTAPTATKSATPEPAAAAPPAVIPLGDIATQASEVVNLLGKLTASAAPSAQIESIAKTLPESSEKLDEHLAATTKSLEAEPTLDALQSLQQDWQRRELETKGWMSVLTTQATKLQAALDQLNDLQKSWSSTRGSAQEVKAPDPILQQIEATLASITTAQTKIQSERTALLDLQSRVAQQVTKCDTVLAQISQIQQKAVEGIFVPNMPPIWRVESWDDALKTFPEHVRRLSIAHWSDIVKYAREPREGGALHAALFIVLALVFAAARRQIAAWEKSGGAASSPILVFERPYAAALATTLLAVTSPFSQMPLAVRQLLTIVMLVPMLRLARPMLSAPIASASYTFCFLLAVDILRQAFSGIRVIGLTIIIAETLAAIVVLFWMRHHIRQIIAERAESSVLMFVKLVRFLIMIVLLVALLAGAGGYARLARLLTPGVLVSGVLALATLAMLRVFGGTVALALRVWPLRLLQMVEHHRDFLERRVYRLLIGMAVVGWLTRYLAYLGLLDPTWAFIGSLLSAKIERGTLSITPGSILEFILVVWAAHLLARFLRFALQEDFYPKIDLAPGLSYALSSLLNYIVLALGFVVGLGVLGVDFSKVSIMAGAFGVGIGFGLQSIVNNFVSGLILLFERPVHVGDTVEVGNLQGTVRRIGIRASVIHTGAGADIIVPNSQLVTDRVTNWTLSDRMRRVDLPIGVNYGADPKKVIELLERVGRANPDVLPDPAPHALFTGYGDSSINFELRVWPRQFNQAGQVKSDLASAVYDAVSAAGMSFPFPQREVRILTDHNTGATTATANALMEDTRKKA
jgi:small-conductance mechanosensitive channel